MKHHEADLAAKLGRLPAKMRVAFAALCGERLAPAYAPFAKRNSRDPQAFDPQALIHLLERLWQDLQGAEIATKLLRTDLEECFDLVPDEDEIWIGSPFHAGDAAAAVAVAYAFSVRVQGDIQDTVFAARGACEALDHFVIHTSGVDMDAADAEERVLMDPRPDGPPLIQGELKRQRLDLEDLRKLSEGRPARGALPSLRRRAAAEAYGFLTA